MDARRRIRLSGKVVPQAGPAPAFSRSPTRRAASARPPPPSTSPRRWPRPGSRVLVIDLDPQGNASTALGIDHHAEVPCIYDVLVDGTPLPRSCSSARTIDEPLLRAGHHRPGRRRDRARLARGPRDRACRGRIALHRPAAARGQARSTTSSSTARPAWACSPSTRWSPPSEVFIPIQCEYYALEGLSQLLKNIELIKRHLNPDLHVSTILLTMYDGRTRLSAQVADEVRDALPRAGAAHDGPAVGARLRGAQPWADRDDLRPVQQRCPLLPRGRRRARRPWRPAMTA